MALAAFLVAFPFTFGLLPFKFNFGACVDVLEMVYDVMPASRYVMPITCDDSCSGAAGSRCPDPCMTCRGAC